MLISEGDAVPRARIVLSAPARSASCSVSSFLSAQLGRNVSGRPQIFWFPWWPTTITSPRICRWKSAAETSLPEIHPSAFRLVGAYSANSVSRKGPFFSWRRIAFRRSVCLASHVLAFAFHPPHDLERDSGYRLINE